MNKVTYLIVIERDADDSFEQGETLVKKGEFNIKTDGYKDDWEVWESACNALSFIAKNNIRSE